MLRSSFVQVWRSFREGRPAPVSVDRCQRCWCMREALILEEVRQIKTMQATSIVVVLYRFSHARKQRRRDPAEVVIGRETRVGMMGRER